MLVQLLAMMSALHLATVLVSTLKMMSALQLAPVSVQLFAMMSGKCFHMILRTCDLYRYATPGKTHLPGLSYGINSKTVT